MERSRFLRKHRIHRLHHSTHRYRADSKSRPGLSVRNNDRRLIQDQVLNCFREAFVIHFGCNGGGRFLYIVVRLTHGNRVSAFSEHQDIVRHISDGRKFCCRDLEKLGKHFDNRSLVGIRVICIVADLPSSARQSFIGIDNRAAGKTAAGLISEFGRSGNVGILTGSLQQRDHQERLLGFRSSLETLAPTMQIVGVQEALDSQEICFLFTKELLERDSNLKAIYHFGADMSGIVHAVQEVGRTDQIVVVGHELTDDSRQLLARGAITAVLSQDASFMAERALATFSDLLRGDLPAHRVYQLGPIGIFLRKNLPPPGPPDRN